ncbi:MAG: hypothetical protein JXR36_04255 [Bacteroidales bacterium]|nr:hypothetical protein [Bacteroidales bacterium]
MTSIDFNNKWNKYLEEGYYGMTIENPKVIEYLDGEFTKEIEANPDFDYAQIKMKFGACRIYASSNKIHAWENEVNRIVNGWSYS